MGAFIAFLRLGQLKVSGESLVEYGLFQGVQGGELLLVDAFEALGFFRSCVQICSDAFLFGERGNEKRTAEHLVQPQVCLIFSVVKGQEMWVAIELIK